MALLGAKPIDPPDAELALPVEPSPPSLPVEPTAPSVSVEAIPPSLLVEATPPSLSVEATPPSLSVEGLPTEPTGSRFEHLPLNYVIPLDFVSSPLRSALREGRKLIFRERTQLISALYQHITTSYHRWWVLLHVLTALIFSVDEGTHGIISGPDFLVPMCLFSHIRHALSQWETMLQCNVVSHWLSRYNDPWIIMFNDIPPIYVIF